MKSSDRPDFLRLMASLGTLYGKAMDKPLVAMYWAALQCFELPAVKRALEAHVKHPDTGQYMPKPADIVRHLEGSSCTQALLAWSSVTRAIREVGGYSSVVFDDPLTHAVIRDMGGWIQLCQVLMKELPFRGHDFTARYEGYIGHPPAQYPRQLTGMLAHQNGVTELAMDRLVCIGDRQKALQVYQQGEEIVMPYSSLLDIDNNPSIEGEVAS